MKNKKKQAVAAISVASAFVAFQPAIGNSISVSQSTSSPSLGKIIYTAKVDFSADATHNLADQIGKLTKEAPREALRDMIRVAAAKKPRKITVTSGPGWAEYHEGRKVYKLN